MPGPVWPFLALTVLAAYGRWQDLSGLSFGSPVNDVALVAGSVPPIVSPLLGVALFARHPTAHRTMPSVAFGVALFAVLTVVDRLRAPILESIASLDPTFASTGPAFLGYGLVQALIAVFALTYLSLGLADARRFEDSPAGRSVLILLLAGAVAAPAVSALLGFAWLSVQPLSSIVSVVSVLATNLAWAYLGWNAYRGLVRRRRAGQRLGACDRSRLRLPAHRGPGRGVERLRLGERREQQPAQFVYEVYLLLGAGLAGVWLALLAAFVVGLPAEADEAANAEAIEDATEADEPFVGAIRPGRAEGRTRGSAGN